MLTAKNIIELQLQGQEDYEITLNLNRAVEAILRRVENEVVEVAAANFEKRYIETTFFCELKRGGFDMRQAVIKVLKRLQELGYKVVEVGQQIGGGGYIENAVWRIAWR